jgi:hypothetical protein
MNAAKIEIGVASKMAISKECIAEVEKFHEHSALEATFSQGKNYNFSQMNFYRGRGQSCHICN